MKKGMLIHSELSYLIASMGHGDILVIGDSGLPVPQGVECIDLAVSNGVPGFLQVLDAVLSEEHVESVVLAQETKTTSPELYKEVIKRVGDKTIKEVSHEDFKKATQNARAIVRTGEYTPYANILLISGVVF